ncbi:uncharacterized protein [Paramisgurnus dabryanus]|uniref:uncharacterized protein n=1 Tax=Paramisgurnus dabryanus TaxID=90735 RepID=UPI003CCF2CE3
MLKNRAPDNQLTSPSQVTASLKGQYKRIAERVRDNPILGGLATPLPNLNAKSFLTFTPTEEKNANYGVMVLSKVMPHLKVLSDAPFPEAPVLPTSLTTPDRPQVQYQHVHHEAGKRRGEKRRLFVEEPKPVSSVNQPVQPMASSSSTRPKPAAPTTILPRPAASTHLRPKPAVPTYGSPRIDSTHTAGFPRTAAGSPVLVRGPSCSQELCTSSTNSQGIHAKQVLAAMWGLPHG